MQYVPRSLLTRFNNRHQFLGQETPQISGLANALDKIQLYRDGHDPEDRAPTPAIEEWKRIHVYMGKFYQYVNPEAFTTKYNVRLNEDTALKISTLRTQYTDSGSIPTSTKSTLDENTQFVIDNGGIFNLFEYPFLYSDVVVRAWQADLGTPKSNFVGIFRANFVPPSVWSETMSKENDFSKFIERLCYFRSFGMETIPGVPKEYHTTKYLWRDEKVNINYGINYLGYQDPIFKEIYVRAIQYFPEMAIKIALQEAFFLQNVAQLFSPDWMNLALSANINRFTEILNQFVKSNFPTELEYHAFRRPAEPMNTYPGKKDFKLTDLDDWKEVPIRMADLSSIIQRAQSGISRALELREKAQKDGRYTSELDSQIVSQINRFQFLIDDTRDMEGLKLSPVTYMTMVWDMVLDVVRAQQLEVATQILRQEADDFVPKGSDLPAKIQSIKDRLKVATDPLEISKLNTLLIQYQDEYDKSEAARMVDPTKNVGLAIDLVLTEQKGYPVYRTIGTVPEQIIERPDLKHLTESYLKAPQKIYDLTRTPSGFIWSPPWEASEEVKNNILPWLAAAGVAVYAYTQFK